MRRNSKYDINETSHCEPDEATPKSITYPEWAQTSVYNLQPKETRRISDTV